MPDGTNERNELGKVLINPDFDSLIPPLSDEELSGLEKSILDEGVRDPIVTWHGYIIDGHNRYRIATKHGIPYEVTEREFADEESVKLWMIQNQLSRRNISPYQRSLLALKLKPLIAAKAKERQRDSGGAVVQKSAEPPIKTRDELATIAGVSHDTIAKVEKLQSEAPAELLELVEHGDMSINAAYQQIRKPHVTQNSGNNEWYTPSEYIEAARAVMGSIDLDPASSEVANQTVKAARFYTEATNGLLHHWRGNVWMNPPYSTDRIGQFAKKMLEELPTVDQAIVLVNNATETSWFNDFISVASAVCFPRGRVRFIDGHGNAMSTPLQGQAVIYIGNDTDRFCEVFHSFGWVAILQ